MAHPCAVAVALALLSGHAHANPLESFSVANNLGTVLASEKLCDLRFKQDAITAYIEKTVAADDMSFPPTLQMIITGSEFSHSKMTPSARTAHCAQIRRIAVSYGFIAK